MISVAIKHLDQDGSTAFYKLGFADSYNTMKQFTQA